MSHETLDTSLITLISCSPIVCRLHTYLLTSRSLRHTVRYTYVGDVLAGTLFLAVFHAMESFRNFFMRRLEEIDILDFTN